MCQQHQQHTRNATVLYGNVDQLLAQALVYEIATTCFTASDGDMACLASDQGMCPPEASKNPSLLMPEDPSPICRKIPVRSLVPGATGQCIPLRREASHYLHRACFARVSLRGKRLRACNRGLCVASRLPFQASASFHAHSRCVHAFFKVPRERKARENQQSTSVAGRMVTRTVPG